MMWVRDAVLREFFSEDDLSVIAAAGVDLPRMATFITHTLEVGGQVSRLMWSLAAWIRLLSDDEDFTFLLHGCAYGFTWAATDPEEFFEVPNYVPAEHESRVTARIDEERVAGRIVPVNRDQVHGISAVGIVDKQRSGFTKFRVVHDYSRPHGGSVNDNMEVAKRKFARFSDAYRSVPMAEEWWPRHAFQWQGQ
eukprot:6163973-Pyramimonas_sp.AAC.1